jgi:hypothetical protein
MEPATVAQMDFDSDESDTEKPVERIAEIPPQVYSAIDTLKKNIYSFKKNLFYTVVSNDSKHKAADLGAMYSFHALFLQCVAYWIGMLDSTPVPVPKFPKTEQEKEFQTIRTTIAKLAASSADARTLVYTLLFQFSTAHPFDLGKQKQED